MTSITGYKIRHRLASAAVDWLADHGYWPDTKDAQMAYHGLRHEVFKVVRDNPGMRCYEIEQKLRIDTPKQRVTNSILRDLEADNLIVALNDKPNSPRRYYNFLTVY